MKEPLRLFPMRRKAAASSVNRPSLARTIIGKDRWWIEKFAQPSNAERGSLWARAQGRGKQGGGLAHAFWVCGGSTGEMRARAQKGSIRVD